MGYGSRALDLLQQYYEGKMIDLDEKSEGSSIQEMETVQEEELDILTENIGNILV